MVELRLAIQHRSYVKKRPMILVKRNLLTTMKMKKSRPKTKRCLTIQVLKYMINYLSN